MNKGYKHHWDLDFNRDWYRCNVCKASISKDALLDTLLEEERIHDCLDRLANNYICKEPAENLEFSI